MQKLQVELLTKLLLFLSGACLLLLPMACERAPTRDQCLVAFANMLYLRMGKPENSKAINEIVESPLSREMSRVCVTEKTLKQVECEIEADSLDELQDCSRFAKKK